MTSVQVRFVTGAVPLTQRLVPVDADMLAEQRACYASAGVELRGPTVDCDIQALRAACEVRPEPRDPTAEHLRIGGVDVRVLEHPNPSAVVLHAHGGGWATGHNDTHDQWLGLLRERAGVTVASVGYRRPPEHPYPAPIDDLATVATWLAGDGLRVLRADRIVVAGESAGANLAAGLLVRLRRSRPDVLSRVVGAAFTYGAYDLANVLPSHRRVTVASPILSPLVLAWVPRLYAGWTDFFHPEVSPLWAELHGMPPALFTVGEWDVLVDDSVLMANRWALAGCPARLDVYPEAVHVFDEFGTRLGWLARETIADWVAERARCSPQDRGIPRQVSRSVL